MDMFFTYIKFLMTDLLNIFLVSFLFLSFKTSYSTESVVFSIGCTLESYGRISKPGSHPRDSNLISAAWEKIFKI